MCGISGIINQSNQAVNSTELNKMSELVSHRGPDGAGDFFGKNFAFAHRRLSIIDLSDKARQPMYYRGLVIVFNGAVYNYIELRDQLKTKQYLFETESDTEVILAAYDYWGKDCVKHFNGMWAFAIYDPNQKIIFCSRDRFGIKPFYYSLIHDQFCFASEIKQFTTIKGWKAKLNRIRAFEFLALGYHDHTAETFFEGVTQLTKGHNLIYNLYTHKFKIEKYYQLNDSKQGEPSFEDAKATFQSLFNDAVKIRLRADVKVGSALSGGLDSSSIVGVVNDLLQANQQSVQQESVSACFPGFQQDESFWIDLVAQKNQIKSHKVFPPFENLLDDLNTLSWQQDEPVAGASLIAQYQVFNTAKAHGITVMLDGQGADEILAGYDKFFHPFFKKMLKRNPFKGARELIQYFKLHNVKPLDALKAVNAFNKKGKPEQPKWLDASFNVSMEELFQRSKDDSIQGTSLNTIYEVGLGALLHYEDRNSMAASVESRLPFLDYRLVEFCISLPDAFKINGARRKYILRESMKPVLPNEVYTRFDKIGFAAPQKQWMQENKDIFDRELEKAVNIGKGIINEKIKSSKDLDLIWRVIAFTKWMEIFGMGQK